MEGQPPPQAPRQYRGTRGGAGPRARRYYLQHDLASQALQRLLKIQTGDRIFTLTWVVHDPSSPYSAHITNPDWFAVRSFLDAEVARVAVYVPALQRRIRRVQADAQRAVQGIAAADGAAQGAPAAEGEAPAGDADAPAADADDEFDEVPPQQCWKWKWSRTSTLTGRVTDPEPRHPLLLSPYRKQSKGSTGRAGEEEGAGEEGAGEEEEEIGVKDEEVVLKGARTNYWRRVRGEGGRGSCRGCCRWRTGTVRLLGEDEELPDYDLDTDAPEPAVAEGDGAAVSEKGAPVEQRSQPDHTLSHHPISSLLSRPTILRPAVAGFPILLVNRYGIWQLVAAEQHESAAARSCRVR